jgi:threonyl-tRNA synthetase
VRAAELDRVNYILVVGEKEINEGTVTVRTRDNKIVGALKSDLFLEQLLKEIKEKK